MTGRTRKTPEQMIAGLERKLQTVKSKAKNMERAKQTRRAIILGQTIQSMADSGDADAKAAMAKVMASLTRKQDRIVFDLEPLSDAAADPLPAAVARRDQAIRAWKDDKSQAAMIEVRDSIAACEKLSGTLFERLPPTERAGFGLGDRPGELLKAS